jgi:hypothetical protein
MGKQFGWNTDIPSKTLINWPSQEPLAHQHISFSDFYLDLQKRNPSRPKDEFKNKIVIIGATAPSLFDNKTTPIATIHPGVDILATTIDNIKNQSVLLDVPPWLRWGLAVLFLVAAAWIQRRGFQSEYNKRFLWAGQVLLMVISWVSLQWAIGSPRFYDLSAPFAFGVLFLTLMGLKNKLVQDAWEYRGLFKSAWKEMPNEITLLWINADESSLKAWFLKHDTSTLIYSLQRYPMLPGMMDIALEKQWLVMLPTAQWQTLKSVDSSCFQVIKEKPCLAHEVETIQQALSP